MDVADLALRDTVSVLDFIPISKHSGIAAGTNADNLNGYFENALATGKRVFVPSGTYHASMVELPTGTYLFGEGPNTILREPSDDTTDDPMGRRGILTVTSGAHDQTVADITVRDIRFEGVNQSLGFSNEMHLLYFRGVKGLQIRNCQFVAFRGDGVLLSGEVETPEDETSYRHNSDVEITGCLFDGIDNNNRNAVSIVDGSNVLILGNRFRNCTKNGNPNVALDPMDPDTGTPMPGAIDIEPNPYPLYETRDIRIAFNDFEHVGGNVGTIAAYVPGAVAAPVQGLKIAFNTFRNSINTGGEIMVEMNRDFDDESERQGVLVVGNRGRGGVQPFRILCVNGLVLDHTNEFEDYDLGAYVSFSGHPSKPRNCTIAPKIKDVATTQGLLVYRGDHLVIGGEYVDAGSAALHFKGGNSGDGTTNVTIRDLKTRNPGSGMPTAIAVQTASPAHSLETASNRFDEDSCDLDGLANEFTSPASWTGATLQNGWANFILNGLAGLKYRRKLDGTVQVRGTLTPGTLTAETVVANIPHPAANRQVFSSAATTSGGSAMVALFRIIAEGEATEGDLRFVGGTNTPGTVYVDIEYQAAS